MSAFFTILTNLGAAAHVNAQVNQTTVPWTHLAVGDGNGTDVTPTQSQTALVREVHRVGISSIEQHPDNPNWVVVEAILPPGVGGFTVREAAIYGGSAGTTCIAVANHPATYKPVLAEGSTREIIIRLIVEVSSAATVRLSIDPAIVTASRAWVEGLHATETKRGIVQLATQTEAEAGTSTTKLPTVLRVMQLLRGLAAQATEALRGTLRIASAEDMQDSDCDDAVATPKKLRQGQQLTPSAIVFPKWLYGICLQWGAYTFNTSTSVQTLAITLPIACTGGVFVWIPLPNDTGPSATGVKVNPTGASNTSISFSHSSNEAYQTSMRWFVIGRVL